MAHGGAAPNPHIQHPTPAPLPGGPRRHLDQGLELIVRAFTCRESEILQLWHQSAEKDRIIAHLQLTLNQTSARLRGALEQNAMLLKNWDARCVMLKQWGLSNLKDGGVANVEEVNKLQAEAAGLKRKAGSEDVKTADGVPAKRVKSDNEPKISVKDEIPTSPKTTATPKASSSPSSKIEQTPSNAPVTEAEIRSALLQKAPITTQDLVAIFKPRLESQKDKVGFVEILGKISKIQKINGQNYVVHREKQ